MSQSSTDSSQPNSQPIEFQGENMIYKAKKMETQNGILTRSNRVAFGNLQNVGLGNGPSDTNILKKKISRTVREKKKQTVVYEEPVKETKDEYVHKWVKEPVLADPFNITLTARRKALREKAAQLDDENDPNEVPNYAFVAFEYFRAREAAQPIQPYLDNQKEINEKMRQVLVDWLVEMQESFQLAHETLYLAVVMTDLYMSKRDVRRDEMQLIGATAILLSSKFYERYPPYLDDLVFVCDEAYSREQFLETEMKLITALNFDINLPVSYLFLRRYAKAMKFTMPQLTLARYVLELSLMEYQFVSVPASKMASAAFLWSLLHFNLDWNDSLVFHTSYERSELINLVVQLNNLVAKAPRRKLKTIYDKYSHENFFEVAKGLTEVDIDPVASEADSMEAMEVSLQENC